MSKREIVIEPDPILRKKSENLEKVDDELRSLLNDMLETMYSAPGIGLAAVQVGILKRLIVIDISKEKDKKDPLFLINPEIISRSKNTSIYEEGCLSLPGHYAEIERPAASKATNVSLPTFMLLNLFSYLFKRPVDKHIAKLLLKGSVIT